MFTRSVIGKWVGERLRSRAQRVMLSCGFAALLCTAATGAGWIFQTDALLRLGTSWPPMVLSAALGLAIAAVALLLPVGTSRIWRQTRISAAALVAVLAIAALVESLAGIHLGIDFAALHEPLQPGNPHPGRMAPNTALALILTALVLVRLDRDNSDLQFDLLHWIGYAVVAIGTTGFFGYLFKFEFLYGNSSVARMAPLAAIVVTLTGMAIAARLLMLREKRGDNAAVDVDDVLAASSFVLIVAVITAGATGFSAAQNRVERAPVCAEAGADAGCSTQQEQAVSAPIQGDFRRALPLLALLMAAGMLLLRLRLRPMVESLVRAKERAERSESRFIMAAENAYESFTVLECVRDEDEGVIDFRFTFCSDGPTYSDGRSRHEMVGHCLSELFPDYRASGVFDRYCRVVETGESFTKEIEASDPAAPEKWLEMKVVRHGDGVAVTTSDISERKLFEQVMHDSEKRFRLLAENAGDLIFRLDLDGTCLYVSPAAREILGCEPSTLMGARLIASIDTEDAPHVETVLHTLASAEIDEATVTCRVQHKDGRRVWSEGKLRLLRDAGSRAPLEIQGTLRDISERRAAEDALRMNEARLVAATESIHDSFTVFEAVRDADGRIIDFRYAFINAVGAQALGRAAEELRGQLLSQIAPRTRSNGFFERCQRVFETGEPASGELCINRLGEDLWVDFKIVRVGDRSEIAVTHRDISERKRHEFLLQESEARMRQMAHHDGLTHLPNRTLFFERLNEAMARAYRSEKPLVVMFIDVDHFKRFNDTYGHAGGDEVLRVVARRLSAAVRASDTVARFAGDEFTLVLESVRNIDDVQLIGEKLLDIMRAPITLGASQVRVTLSIGAAFLEGGTATVDTMMTTADTALYEVKQSGRDGFRAITVGALDGAMRDKPLPAEWFDQLTLVEMGKRK